MNYYVKRSSDRNAAGFSEEMTIARYRLIHETA